MKKTVVIILLLLLGIPAAWAAAEDKPEIPSFRQWLFEYIPGQYPDAKLIDHHYWLQAFLPDGVVVNWTEWTDADSTFKAMQAHNLTPGKAMFVEQKGPRKRDWADHPSVTHYDGGGYYISGYDPETMGRWDGKGLTVIQFDGDATAFAREIAAAWARENAFENWLYRFLPKQYPNARMAVHYNKWKQAHITDHIVASWEQWNAKGITLKEIEPESLTQGKAFFIEQKGPRKNWADHPAVTHYEGAGYYVSGYDQATMRGWGVEGLTVIQFDGDCEDLARTIAAAWAKKRMSTSAKMNVPSALKVSTEKLDGINTFKVETAMGTFHWECDPGKSGWMSAFDNNGKDWITAGPKQRGVGVNSQFRGLPNSGADDWGHPSRNWVHTRPNVTSKIVGPTEGDRIIIESEGNTIKARWHCFHTHIAMEVVELKNGMYHFLWEGTPGGTIHTEQGIVTADGKTREIKEGWFAETPDWPAGENGEWFYILDPNKKYNMWMAQTPATNDKGELWYQKGNMDLASFGRPDNKPTFTDTERTFAWGFIPYEWDFETVKKHIETILESPLEQKRQAIAAATPPDSASNASKKRRVIMMSDFPPIGVVKGGDNVPNTMKSDPDDMQSMVRFLLYSNEFDIEGLVAAAGTFAMEAHKKNMLDVLDRYAMVYENLKSHDSEYPAPDDLRSVTYEGLGSNHGLSIQWGSKTQPVMDIIGEGKDSEASNAIIAAADKPDPRPLWIGVWGGAREVSQAIWRVRNDRNEDEFKAFLGKFRVFLIAYQDCTHGWLMEEFPDLFIIDSRQTYQGMFGGRDPISNLAWVNENIRNNHGPLCDIYPHEGMGCTGVCEGDSPTFLYLVSANRGINDPEDPTQESWGGQYKHKPGTNHYVDGPGGSSIAKWRKDFQEEFADRADWCVEPAKPKVQKPRIIHTTDLGADPDDEQSMVRFLVCSNEFDTEGLIVATGCWKKTQNSTAMLDKLVDAYAQAYDNLKVHAEGYPTPAYLKSISVMGQRGYGMSDVGAGKDSPGSELIIAAVDKNDPRPVWVGGWGGVNNVAQAIWKVRQTRSEAELAKFISKLRVFDILGQDDAGAWLAKNFPDLFYIRATGVYGWQPPKNGSYQREDIQSHGPLGAVYPDTKWATEGDTPAFMHVYPNGLNEPEQIDQGGWGGRFSFTKKANIRSMSEVAKINKEAETQYDPYYMYGNTSEGANAIKRWSDGYNNDFAARMDWTMSSNYSSCNHHPVAVVNGDSTRQVLTVSASAGSSVALSAAGSSDPDGNSLVYSWAVYTEPSSYKSSVSITGSTSSSATVSVPSDAGGKTIHVILTLRDNGSPNLYAYRRVIINVQ